MTTDIIKNILIAVVNFYSILIIVYVLMSWIPRNPEGGLVEDLRDTLATLVDPYLKLFKFIPPIGGVLDISPILAIVVLELILKAISYIL